MPVSLKKLTNLYDEVGRRYRQMSSILSREDDALFRTSESVSAWSVANQLHHTADATALMLVAVDRIAKKTSPAEDGGSLTPIGRAVLIAKRFPRGKGQAPARTMPPDVVTRAILEKTFSRSQGFYDGLRAQLEGAAASDWRTKHPYFGMLNAAEWLKLASIHADHHFALIRDIDSATEKA